MRIGSSWFLYCVALQSIMFAGHPIGQAPSTHGPSLAGTSWQLVRFQGGDDTIATPDDGSKYTIAFGQDGAVAARIDCNRGRGTWKSPGPNQLELGPLALTRALCPPQSMHDQIVKQWSNIRSYVIKDGHLFLALKLDSGIYEFQPQAGTQTGTGTQTLRSSVTSRGPVTWMCTDGNASLRATFYKTQPAMVLLERGGVTRPAFQVVAASGSKYEGDGVLFWEARGEAMLTWMGVESKCKPNAAT